MKRIIIMAAIGVLVVVFEGLIVWWLARQISVRVERIANAQTLLAETEGGQFEFAVLKHDYERVRDFIPRLEAVFPAPEALFEVIGQINRLAETTGNRQTLSVEGYFPKSGEIAGVSFIPFSAGISSSYQSLRSYLKALKNAPFFIKVESINISSSETIIADSKIRMTGKIFLKEARPQ